jgi:hypothetical protein
MLPIPQKLLAAGVRDMVRISDARMSGTSYGTCILHVSPESHLGGPLALVATGDEIERFYAHLEAALIDLDFLNHGSPGKLMLKLRWLFARTRLAREEVNILRGILTAAQAAKRGVRRQGNADAE